MAIFKVLNSKNQELYRSEPFLSARVAADELCNRFSRRQHFRVVREEVVYISSTLDEVLENEWRENA